MTNLSRIVLILACTCLYWGASTIMPALISSEVLKYLSGLFAFIITIEFLFFRQLNGVTGGSALNAAEMERLSLKRDEIRSRIWRTGAIAVAAMVTLFILSLVTKEGGEYSWLSFAVGFLVAIGLNYVSVIISWINQLARFSDKLNEFEKQQKDFVEQLKRLKDATKKT